MCEHYRKSVKETAIKIDNLITEETSGMTINAKEDRRFNIESKVDTIKQLSNEYKKYHYDLTSTGEAKNIEFYINNLKEVMEIVSKMESKLKFEDEKEKEN